MNDSQRLKLIKDLLSFFYKSFEKKKKIQKIERKIQIQTSHNKYFT